MSDFSELNEYLMAVMVDIRRERIITTCQNLAAAGMSQVLPDVDRLLNMSNDGEAGDVIDDLCRMMFDHLYELTLNLGFVWADDVDWTTHFNLLSDVLQAITLVNGVEDYGDIAQIVNDELMTVEEKVTELFQMVLVKDMTVLLESASSIDQAVIDGIVTSLTTPYADEDQLPPDSEIDYVKERLVKYNEKLYKGIAYTHIAHGGALGVTYDSLLQFYNDPISRLIDEDLTVLTQELIGFALVSDVIDDMLQDEICKQLDIYVDDKLRLNDLGCIVTGFFA